MELKEITKGEINKKIDNLQIIKSNSIFNEEVKKVIESLKYTCEIKEKIRYNLKNDDSHEFYGVLVLKNKFIIFMINNQIFIFDINDEKIKKIYDIIGLYKSDLFSKKKSIIKEWKNSEDNEFILTDKINVILFKLNEEENNNISLKIVGQSYYPDSKE